MAQALTWSAYHGEIGREATAPARPLSPQRKAYHGEIGREATAPEDVVADRLPAYHGEIGREATAGTGTGTSLALATTGKSVGKPRLCLPSLLPLPLASLPRGNR